MSEAPQEGAPVHRQRPHLFTHIDYSLRTEGILEEEYTSEVLTHSKLLPYEEIWDGFFDRSIPRIRWLAPGLPAMSAIALALMGRAAGAWGCAGAAAVLLACLLAFGWRCVYTAFDYEGHWVVTFEDADREPFHRFLDHFYAQVQRRRFPLQKVLEGLPLGEVALSSRFFRWSCRFSYDRILVERQGPWKSRRRRYHSLSALRAPVRLVWKPSWAGLASAGLGVLAAGALAWRHPQLLQHIWAWAGFGLAAGVALAVSLCRAAVSAPAGDGAVASPAFPIVQRRQMQGVLLWFSRLANLSDRLEDLRSDDYWEYHREKVTILRQQGFLDEWPFRSTLGKINSQERENLAPEP